MDGRRKQQELENEIVALRCRLAALGDEFVAHRMLLEQLPIMVWKTDTDFRCTYWAGGGLKRLGLDPNQLLDGTMYDYFGSEDPTFPPIDAHHRAILGESRSYEVTFSGMTAQCHVEPLYDEDAEIVGVIGIALDITERARGEAEREILIADLRRALALHQPLGKLVRICAGCKRIRDAGDRWVPFEHFLEARTKARFTHALCPGCLQDVDPRNHG